MSEIAKYSTLTTPKMTIAIAKHIIQKAANLLGKKEESDPSS